MYFMSNLQQVEAMIGLGNGSSVETAVTWLYSCRCSECLCGIQKVPVEQSRALHSIFDYVIHRLVSTATLSLFLSRLWARIRTQDECWEWSGSQMTKSTRTLRFPRTQESQMFVSLYKKLVNLKVWLSQIDGVFLSWQELFLLVVQDRGAQFLMDEWLGNAFPSCLDVDLRFFWVEHCWRTGSYRKPLSFTRPCAMCIWLYNIVYVKCM